MLRLRVQRLLPCLLVLGVISILAMTSRQLTPYVEVALQNNPLSTTSKPRQNFTEHWKPNSKIDSHPIIELLKHADDKFDTLMRTETYDLQAAARRYRELRGRHPPPGFDKWWRYAKKHNAIIVEEFWDQIYHDINPLWALNQKEMLNDVRSQDPIFKIRKGKVKHKSKHFWMDIWKDLIETISEALPDMDLAMNTMDESRLIVPSAVMEGYVAKELKMRNLLPVTNITGKFSRFLESSIEKLPDFAWNRSYDGIWERHIASCPPFSNSRRALTPMSISSSPLLTNVYTYPHTYHGYVSNYTLSCSICHQPDLRSLHGFFIEPISIATTTKLIPLFGSSKLTVNSEILLPAAMYYANDPRFTLDSNKIPEIPWEAKTDTLFWRGLASGGRNRDSNWKGFHRHRLVSLTNGTQALSMPHNSSFIDIASLPLSPWHLSALHNTSVPAHTAMGEWLHTFTNVSFHDLNCYPTTQPVVSTCSYTDYIFTPNPTVHLSEVHRNKYLVDVDGNSFSGRYLDFLRSGSLPIKSTLFREWHDSRLVAWKHFVPLDNRFLDLYGVMEFFVGYDMGGARDMKGWEQRGRDQLAKRIAEEGRDWAERVLRREDMSIYMFRLLLEYARVMDENRENLGWVKDLKGDLNESQSWSWVWGWV